MSLDIIAPYSYNYTFPEPLKNELNRAIFIETIERLLVNEFCDVVFLEGATGSGKTTILSQFVKKHSKNCLSYFVSSIDKYSQSRESINLNLFYQFNYYLRLNEEDPNIVPDNFIRQLRPLLDRKIRKHQKGEYLFFVFDGFQSLTKQGLEVFHDVLGDLPWGKVKFVFSGNSESLQQVLPALNKLKIRSYPVSYFSLEEISEYFSEFGLDSATIDEIHFLSQRGLPEILSQIKRNCVERGVSVVISELRNSKVSLFEMDWQKVNNDFQIRLLSILTFSEPFYIIGDLVKILSCEENYLKDEIQKIPFLNLKGNTVSFINQEYLSFSKKKLDNKEQETLSTLISYYLKNEDENPNGSQLSNLYLKSKRWGDLLKYLSFETFIKLIEQNNTFSTINNQLDIGLKVSKTLNSNYGDYLRFALPKASFQEIETIVGLESEIQARISIGDNEGAMSLLNNTYLKEDRLKLLALIAKQKKENKLIVDSSIINEINDLYKTIDLSILKDGAIQLASTLLYSCPDLAIDLVEKSVDNSSDNKKLDKAYALLSLNAINANKRTNSNLADLSTIQSKIHNNEEKDLVSALSHLVEEYNANDIIEKSNSLNSSNRKLYLLKNWIKHNLKDETVLDVVEASIKEIIRASGEDAPNATTLMELALPLPHVKNKIKLNEIVKLFDTQKTIINTPTRDFIKLQLLIAEAERSYDINNCISRLLAIYYSISELEDIGIRNDCLVQLWLKLKSIDVDNEIEKKEGLKSLAKQDIDQLLDNLLNETAFHFEVMEYIISYSVEYDTDFAIHVINKLNIEPRRDYGYKLAVDKYSEHPHISDLNMDFVIKCFNSIQNKSVKDSTLLTVVDLIYSNLNQPDIAERILVLLENIKQISDSEYRCYAICKTVGILNKVNRQTVITDLLNLLEKSWLAIDSLWIKVDVASKIAKDISYFSKEIAEDYLKKGVQEKGDSLFESYSSALSYTMSLNLALRAFSGLIRTGNNYDDDLNTLYDLINVIPSNGERIRLYSILAIKFFEKNENATFKEIFKKHIINPLNELKTSLDQDYFRFVFKSMGPALYLYHTVTFYTFIDDLPLEIQQPVLINTCSYLLKGIYPDEYFDGDKYIKVIDYEIATELVILIEKMTHDNGIYASIKDFVQSLKNNKEISVNQRNIILNDLTKIINTKLPNIKTGIQHTGYRILSNVYIDSLKGQLEKSYIDMLISEIQKIPNASDRTLLLHVIAKELKFKSSHQKLDVLIQAFSEAKKIPSNYDMVIRYEEMLPTMAEIDKSQFKKIVEDLISTILNDKEDENIYSKHKKLIDLLHQYDPKNIGNYINLFDKDPARNKKDTQKIKDQIALLDREKTYIQDIKKAKKFNNSDELSDFSFHLLSKLKTGEFTSKEPMDTIDLLESATKYPMTDGFNTFSFCIENVVQKYQRGTKNNDILRSVYEATIFNVKLISTLSQSSILKMRNRYSIISKIGKTDNKSFFQAGQRERVVLYLKNWLETLDDNNIILVDPYFKFQDVDFIKMIKEIKPDSEVFILTSKEGLKGSTNYEEEYLNSWESICVEPPPATTIKIAWIDGSDKTPFHDRYLINGTTKALRLGSSYRSIGIEKDAEISIMTSDQIIELEDSIIKDYVYGSKNFHKDKRLKYKTFSL